MQFLLKNSFKTFKLYLWKIDESEKELEKGVLINESLRKRLDSLKSKEHRKGILSIRQLMKIAGIIESDLYYDSNGAPNLKSGKYISISHSKYFSGIGLSDFQIGIDIESFREKIIKIGPKFLNIKENSALGKIEELTFIWTAKEATYKAFRTPGISFSEQINIDKPYNSEKVSRASVFHNNQYKFYDIVSIKLDSHIVNVAHEKN
jgi:phosphopantetheinyl transferase